MIVVYRACSQSSPYKPAVSKHDLIEKCFPTLIEAFKDVKHELVIILDKPTPRLRKLFKDYTVIELYTQNFNTGNTETFHKQIDVALASSHDSFFLVEDDYMFTPDAGKKMYEASKMFPFVTPYDHLDYYKNMELHNYDRRVTLCANHHFATVSATTLTFAGRTDVLHKEHKKMRTYGWADYDMWLDITHRHNLYAPIPTLATHMEKDFYAPRSTELIENLS